MHGLGGGRLWVGLPFHPLERFRCLKVPATRAPECVLPARTRLLSGDFAAFR